MVLSDSERGVSDRAKIYARKHKKVIAKEIASTEKFPKEEGPVSVFMAGSPGAGKTESSKALIETFGGGVLRIDPDELRNVFDEYDGSNSWLFQGAVSILVDKIHDLALMQSQSFIFDGTLTNFERAKENIKRSLKRDRSVQILYVYQDPLTAWSFVQARESVEGRRILLKHFIEQYFKARESVNRLKERFGSEVKLDLLLQNGDNLGRLYKANIDRIDNHVPEKYNPLSLESLINRA
ncbi:MAG: zeta toxin family protein [Pseudomonadales bacterium]